MVSELLLGFLGSTELIIVLLIVLLLFGGTALPKLARSLGRAQREFRDGVEEGPEEGPEDGPEEGEAETQPTQDSTST